MAMPRSSFSCTAGLQELANSTFPSLSRGWPATTLAAATERTINGTAIWLRMFMVPLLFEATRSGDSGRQFATSAGQTVHHSITR